MMDFSAPSLRELLDDAAARFGDKPFIRYIRDGRITDRSFLELRRDSLSVCRMLRSAHPEKSNIAIIGGTSYDYLVFLTGIIISGNAAVPLSPELSAAEAAMLSEKTDIAGVFYDASFSLKAQDMQRLYPAPRFYTEINGTFAADVYRTYSDSSPYARLSDFAVCKKDCAVIIFTSGTTGVKKGVMLSSDALIGNIMYRDLWEDTFTEGDACLSVLPMVHCYCLSGDYIKNLKDGVQLCICENPAELTDCLALFAPKVMRVVPMILQSLLRRIKASMRKNPEMDPRQAAEAVFGKNIRRLISGGAYLAPSLVREYKTFGIAVLQGYGMTEAGCRISVPDGDESSARSVGAVPEFIEVRTSPEGEIQVKTPTVMLGYYKMPEATAEMFTSDGWLKTGDVGYIDERRRLFITGRIKNLIILSGGENVSPEAIEKKFVSCPLVKEVLVYGENDRIIAEIYPDELYARENGITDIAAALGVTVDEMNRSAKASHVISVVRLRDKPFAKTESGKIKRTETVI